MEDVGRTLATQTGELLDPLQRVERVPRDELPRSRHRPARALVLVAPVLVELRRTREVEVEVRRPPGGAGGAGEDHAQDVCVLVAVDERPEEEQLGGGFRRVPVADERRHVAERLQLEAAEPGQRVAKLAFEDEEVVALGLDPHQQAVERRDVDADRIPAALERLDERRPRAGERIEHARAGCDVALQQRLDELRNELAEVRVKAVDVLRPHALRQVAFRPGELEIDLGVEGVLRGGHAHGVRVALERSFHAVEPARSLDHDVEAHFELRELRPRGEPRLGGAPDPALLFRPDHVERIAPAIARLGLHFAEHEAPSTTGDDVDLVAACPRVDVQDPVPTQEVMTCGAVLGPQADAAAASSSSVR